MFASMGNAKNDRFILDPHTYYWVQPSAKRLLYFAEYPGLRMHVNTNDLGFRKDVDTLDPPPDLRILVTGDSHAEGVVANTALFTERLELALREQRPERTVEVLNAAKGGYCFYNYLGVLEKFEALAPDLFIVTVYGGNDWVGSVRPRRFFEGLPPGPSIRQAWRKAIGPASKGYTPLLSQYLIQVLDLQSSTENKEVAREAGLEVMQEIALLCKERGIPMLLVYLPAAADGQRPFVQPMLDEVNALVDLGQGAFEIANLLADELLQHAATQGAKTLDLRANFSAAEPFLYWKKDHHINILGHQRVADALLPVIESLFPE